MTFAIFLDFVHKKGCANKRTDRQTDRQTDRHLYQNNMLPAYGGPLGVGEHYNRQQQQQPHYLSLDVGDD